MRWDVDFGPGNRYQFVGPHHLALASDNFTLGIVDTTSPDKLERITKDRFAPKGDPALFEIITDKNELVYVLGQQTLRLIDKDGRLTEPSNKEHNIRIFDSKTLELKRSFKTQWRNCYLPKLAPNGRWLIFLTDKLWVMDLASGDTRRFKDNVWFVDYLIAPDCWFILGDEYDLSKDKHSWSIVEVATRSVAYRFKQPLVNDLQNSETFSWTFNNITGKLILGQKKGRIIEVNVLDLLAHSVIKNGNLWPLRRFGTH